MPNKKDKKLDGKYLIYQELSNNYRYVADLENENYG
jgi:hypothetical protein